MNTKFGLLIAIQTFIILICFLFFGFAFLKAFDLKDFNNMWLLGIKDENVLLPREPFLNCTGAGIVCSDNPFTVSTDIFVSGGGSGAPGGLDTQLQWNNNGSFDGLTGAVTNGTFVTLIAPVLGTPQSGTLTNTVGLPLTTGVVGILPLINGGTEAALVANNGGIFYSDANSGEILAGTPVTRRILLSGVSSAPFWSIETIDVPGTSGYVLTSDGTNWISAPATGITVPGGLPTQLQYNNSGAFGGIINSSTDGTTLTLVAPILGTPISVTLTNADGLPLTTGVVGILPLANGGTNANLTANNGGIFYSNASAGAILAGTSIANQILMSGSNSAPSWSTATYPVLAGTNGNVLTSNGANWVSVAPTVTSSIRWDQVIAPNTTAGFVSPNGNETTLTFQNSTQTAWTMQSSTLTTGKLLNIVSTSTSLIGTSNVSTISVSGANSASSVVAQGLNISVTNSGATSTNTALILNASGASVNNGLIVATGNVGIGNTSPSALLTVGSIGNNGKIDLLGTTSGVVSVTTNAIAGTWTFTLPTSGGINGYFLQTNGSGITTWAPTTGATVPGGSPTQLQYNNSGAFGGIINSSTDGTTLTLVAPILGTPISVTLTNADGLPLTTGVVGILPLANGGTNANLTASNGGIFYSNASSGAILSGTAIARRMLLSQSSIAPIWSVETIDVPGSSGNVLTSDGTNWISSPVVFTGIVPPIQGGTGIANNNASTLTWSGAFPTTITLTGFTSVTMPTSGTLATLANAETFTNKLSYNGLVITSNTGAITTGSWAATIIPLAFGGTSANLTANNGGIFYSNATTGAILAGTATAGQIIRSGSSSAPSWSTATYPNLAGTSGNVLTSDGTNWVSSAVGITARWDQITAPNTLAGFISPAGTETTLTFQSTTQTAWIQQSSTLTTGKLLSFISTSTALTTGTRPINTISLSGINSNSSVIAQALTISVTNTGTTNTNTALVLSSSGASTNNYSLQLNGGDINVTSNTTILTPSTLVINAYSLGGIVSGGGNQINNVIIGTVTPLAGFFTTITSGINSVSSGLINLKGSSTGTVSITTAVTAGTWTLTLPIDDGNNGDVLFTNGSGVTAWGLPSFGARWDQITAPNTTAGFISPAGNETTLTFLNTNQNAWTMIANSRTTGSLLRISGSSGALAAGHSPLVSIYSENTTIAPTGVNIQGASISALNSISGAGNLSTALTLKATANNSNPNLSALQATALDVTGGVSKFCCRVTGSLDEHSAWVLTSSTVDTGVMLGLNLVNTSTVITTSANFASMFVLDSTATTFATSSTCTGGSCRLAMINSVGANANTTVVLEGLKIRIINTGTTNTNKALVLTASGGSTANYALEITAGEFRTASTITFYDNKATAGEGVAPIYGSTKQRTESAADANVLTVTPIAATGTYRLTFTLDISAANTATLGWTATWKDSNGTAQAPTNLNLTKNGATSALTYAATAGDTYSGTANISIDNSATNIVIQLTFAGTSFTGKASATIERLN